MKKYKTIIKRMISADGCAKAEATSTTVEDGKLKSVNLDQQKSVMGTAAAVPALALLAVAVSGIMGIKP
jgi:hypothetical protein